MDYNKHYDLLIEKYGYAEHPQDGGYYERHHIKPCELFPLKRKDPEANRPENLVYLSGRAHLLAHWLLALMYPNTGLVHAFNTMANTERGTRVTSKMYEAAKRLHGERISGKNNPIHSLTDEQREEWKKNISTGNKRAMELNGDEIRRKISEASLKRSDELSEIYAEINRKKWAPENREAALATLTWHSPEARAKRSKTIKARMAAMTPEERIAMNKHFAGVPKERVCCPDCGSDVTVNTLAKHRRSLRCTPKQEIIKRFNKGESMSSIARDKGVSQSTIRRVLEDD